MREIKFRVWYKINKEMRDVTKIFFDKDGNNDIMSFWPLGEYEYCQEIDKDNYILMQYIGLKDINDKEYYIGDIAEYDNGDRFVIKMEKYLEVYVDWIGSPECEDQARDLYRIERAKIIGNIYKNPDLIDK
jgi:uncharacterized phage protein (TIGR01671 family)